MEECKTEVPKLRDQSVLGEYMRDIEARIKEVVSIPNIEKRRVRIKHPYSEYLDQIDCIFQGEILNEVPHGIGRFEYAVSEVDNWQSFSGFGQFVKGKL